MGFLNFKKQEETIEVDTRKEDENNEQKSVVGEQEIEKVVEYIWVDGYKGMDSNMTCRGFKYEIGQTYSTEEDPKLCESGFHFCKELKDVFVYYNYDFKNKFYKVRCLVNKIEYEQYGKQVFVNYGFGNRNYETVNKLTAKEIQVIEEVKLEELFNTMKACNPDYMSWIDTVQEFAVVKNMKSFVLTKFKNLLERYYSESFSIILYEQCCKMNGSFNSNLKNMADKALTFAKDGISMDMCAYLLLCH